MNPTSKPLSLTPQEIAIFKAMSPAEKLAIMTRMYADARSLKKAGLRQHLRQKLFGDMRASPNRLQRIR